MIAHFPQHHLPMDDHPKVWLQNKTLKKSKNPLLWSEGKNGKNHYFAWKYVAKKKEKNNEKNLVYIWV